MSLPNSTDCIWHFPIWTIYGSYRFSLILAVTHGNVHRPEGRPRGTPPSPTAAPAGSRPSRRCGRRPARSRLCRATRSGRWSRPARRSRRGTAPGRVCATCSQSPAAADAGGLSTWFYFCSSPWCDLLESWLLADEFRAWLLIWQCTWYKRSAATGWGREEALCNVDLSIVAPHLFKSNWTDIWFNQHYIYDFIEHQEVGKDDPTTAARDVLFQHGETNGETRPQLFGSRQKCSWVVYANWQLLICCIKYMTSSDIGTNETEFVWINKNGFRFWARWQLVYWKVKTFQAIFISYQCLSDLYLFHNRSLCYTLHGLSWIYWFSLC